MIGQLALTADTTSVWGTFSGSDEVDDVAVHPRSTVTPMSPANTTIRLDRDIAILANPAGTGVVLNERMLRRMRSSETKSGNERAQNYTPATSMFATRRRESAQKWSRLESGHSPMLEHQCLALAD